MLNRYGDVRKSLMILKATSVILHLERVDVPFKRAVDAGAIVNGDFRAVVGPGQCYGKVE